MSNYSNNPAGGWVEAGGFFYLSASSDRYGVVPSDLLIGGHQEVIKTIDRDAIPINSSGVIGPDGTSSGRRKIGMTVTVIDPEGNGLIESKTYCLLPKGYFGNEGQLSIQDWNLLSGPNKAVLLDPTASITYTDENTGDDVTATGSGNPDDCWVELIRFTEHPLPAGGSAGEVLAKIDNEDYNLAWVSPQAGPQGEPGPQGNIGPTGDVQASWIGNMFTHPNFPGATGISGLMYDGEVQVSIGDIFSINMYGGDGAPSNLNGVFIAVNDFTVSQSASGANAIAELLTHNNLNFQPFSPAVLPILNISQDFVITLSPNNKFEVNGVEQDTITLVKGLKYSFDASAVESSHPFGISSTEDGTNNGGTFYGVGVSDIDGLSFTIDTHADMPNQLFYFCGIHAGMGGTINLVYPGGNYQDSDVAAFLNGNLNTHIIPDTNATYDIGSAEKKIRHLYLSDNSLYFGDDSVQLNSTKVLNTLNFSQDPLIPTVPEDPAGGVPGDIRFDAFYMYVCFAAGQWKRIPLDDSWGTI